MGDLMGTRQVRPGDLVAVVLPHHRPDGTEQEGYRPAVVVGFPDVLGQPRFPLVLLAPVTTDRNQPWAVRSPYLYPRLPAATAGLLSPSVVLLDQLRSVDVRRVRKYLGTLPAEHFGRICAGLTTMIGG